MAGFMGMYVEGMGQKSGPCTATFNDLLCLGFMGAYLSRRKFVSMTQCQKKENKNEMLLKART
jgi:hypothetical protein